MLLLGLLGEAPEEDRLGHLVVFSCRDSWTILYSHQLCKGSRFSPLPPTLVLVFDKASWQVYDDSSLWEEDGEMKCHIGDERSQ